MEKFTEEQFDKIGHTLGINIYHCLKSKSKKDKILPDKFYRNYYNYGQTKDEIQEPEWITELSDYIDKWTQSGLLYFQVSDKGIVLFKQQFKEEITDTYTPLSKSKQRYQDYMDADLGISFSEFIGIKKNRKVS
jgi:hypothetical protein